jgi:hypothetical protein
LSELLEGDVDELDPSEWQVPVQSIPVHANVTRFNWEPLAAACKFDVIMMDPPWQARCMLHSGGTARALRPRRPSPTFACGPPQKARCATCTPSRKAALGPVDAADDAALGSA